MVWWCTNCGKHVPGIRPYDGALACNLCGRILENFNFSTEVTFVKTAAGQCQASGNIVRSVQSGISSSRERRIRRIAYEREPDYSSLSKSREQCSENGDGGDAEAEASDESDNFSDISDHEMDGYLHNEEEKRYKKIIWEEMNREYLEEQATKEVALKAASEALNVSNANCPEYARKLVEASKAAVTKSRKESQQKRAEEAKKAPPPATAMEAVCRTLEKKRLSGLINYDVLDELFDTSPSEESPKRSKTKADMENKEVESYEHENGENEDEEEDEAEEDKEGYAASYDMNEDFQNDEKFYEDEEEEEDDYDFGLY